ncbi:MAG: zinc ribbon domain-containing protein [Candidatus Caldarchaeales archaeon]
MRLIAAGYFLCALNAMPFVLFPLYPVALVSYPVSIGLRSVGWRRLGRSIGGGGFMFPALAALGALTYVSVVAGSSGDGEQTLPLAAIPWTVYSVMDAYWYVRLGSSYRVRTFYLALVSLYSVAYLDYVAFSGLLRIQALQAPSDATVAFVVAAGVAMMVSGVSAGVSFLRLGTAARGRALFTEPRLRARAPLRPTEGAAPPVSPATAPVPAAPQRPSAPSVPSPAGGRVKVEAVSASRSMVCSGCGAESPLDAVSCPSCGRQFRKVAYGLRCPVCSAPLSIARKVGEGHLVCAQCFSDLSVRTV